ncbi:MAG: HAD family hydrolase [Dehalococcoidia bacterium]|nr:HAD family hydrolase [Dehalococcoidia bacterium]
MATPQMTPAPQAEGGPTRIRAVFFDFQDTLARFRDGAWNSAYGLYVEAAREHGVDIDPEAIVLPTEEAWADFQTPDGPAHPEGSRSAEAFQQVRIAVHRRRLARAGVTGDLADSIGRRIDEFEARSERYELFPDVLPALNALGRLGVQCVVVSNHIWRLHEIVRDLGLGAKFEGVVNSAHVGYRKPHPKIYSAALRLTGIPPEDTMMVGDSYSHDVQGAERLGIHGVLLDRDGASPPRESVRVIRTLTEVPLQWP